MFSIAIASPTANVRSVIIGPLCRTSGIANIISIARVVEAMRNPRYSPNL
jgi:hypothetical protein